MVMSSWLWQQVRVASLTAEMLIELGGKADTDAQVHAHIFAGKLELYVGREAQGPAHFSRCPRQEYETVWNNRPPMSCPAGGEGASGA